jgi:hypothetical protein
MKSRAIACIRVPRSLALIWLLVAGAGAVLQAHWVWTALATGRTSFPTAFGLGPVSRTAEPLMFHGALAGMVLAGIALLYVGFTVWRLRR